MMWSPILPVLELLGISSDWHQTVFVASTCAFILFQYYNYKNTYSFWEKKGIKGPKPLPIVGNMHDLLLKPRMAMELKWTREYGKVYGVYRGSKPTLMVSDPEVIVQLCVKDFDAMPNHDRETPFQSKLVKSFVFSAKDQHWKKIRTTLTPTFTSGKIKRMFRLINECAEDSVKCFREQLKNGEEKPVINLKDLFSLYTMDGITRCCYGLKLERAGSADLKSLATRNEFVKTALKIFEFKIWKIFLAIIVPNFILQVSRFTLTNAGVEELAQKVRSLIKNRRQSDKKHDDFLQLLIDAKSGDKLELNELDQEENHHAGLTAESIQNDQKKMSAEAGGTGQLDEDEIVSNATFMVAVGFETTSAAITHCVYALAFHPEIQEKLYIELTNIAQRTENALNFDYESITSCQYLDAVISETLRLIPTAVNLERQLNRDHRVEKYGLDLPKNMHISLGVAAAQNDPEYWDEPEKFNPERFMPGNKERIVPGSYAPFGLGPRHCLGMRFGLTEAKLGIAKLVADFRFEPAPDTKFPTDPKFPFIIQTIKRPFVKLVSRY